MNFKLILAVAVIALLFLIGFFTLQWAVFKWVTLILLAGIIHLCVAGLRSVLK